MVTPITAPESVTTTEDNLIPLFADGRQGDNVNDAYRLERAIARVRRLLNDPVALRLRATALLDGTAKPLLGLVLALAVSTFTLSSPMVTGGNHHRRRAPMAAVVVAVREVV